MRDKKIDASEARKARELAVYVRPSIKAMVVQQSENEYTSKSKIVSAILDNHYKNNPIEVKPKFDY